MRARNLDANFPRLVLSSAAHTRSVRISRVSSARAFPACCLSIISAIFRVLNIGTRNHSDSLPRSLDTKILSPQFSQGSPSHDLDGPSFATSTIPLFAYIHLIQPDSLKGWKWGYAANSPNPTFSITHCLCASGSSKTHSCWGPSVAVVLRGTPSSMKPSSMTPPGSAPAESPSSSPLHVDAFGRARSYVVPSTSSRGSQPL